MANLKDILHAFRDGGADINDTVDAINQSFFQEIDDTTIDHDRQRRTGQSEVIYGAGKTPEQIVSAFQALAQAGLSLIHI